MSGLTRLKMAKILDFRIADSGAPVYDIVDEDGTVFTDITQMVMGGSHKGMSYRPFFPTTDTNGNEIDYKGCHVITLKTNDDPYPVIVGGVLTEHAIKNRISPTRKYDTDQQLDVEKQCVLDETSKMQGSFQSLGEEGITLDTTETVSLAVPNGQPIRLQTPNTNHVRISQQGQTTTDHVVLASVLLAKLDEIEATLLTIAGRVNILSEVCSGIEAEKVALAAAAGNVYVPKITELDPNVSGWTKGSDASYQADCVRISSKPVGV